MISGRGHLDANQDAGQHGKDCLKDQREEGGELRGGVKILATLFVEEMPDFLKRRLFMRRRAQKNFIF